MRNTELKYNERAWAIDLISFLNSQVSEEDVIRRIGGEYSLKEEKQTLFPDILLFGDSGSGNILQGWELKMPDTPINDQNFINNATTKARRLGLNSFLLWNAVDIRLYISDKNNIFNLDAEFNIHKSEYIDRYDVYKRPDIWKRDAISIIKILNTYFKTGRLIKISPQMIFSDKGIIPVVLSCQYEVKKYLENIVINNPIIDANIKKWWRCVHKEYPGYEEALAPLAYTIILRWFNRFVFYNILYAYGKVNIKNDSINLNTSIENAIQIFNKISSVNDFWNIMGTNEYDIYLPSIAWEKLVSIYLLLKEYDFSQIDKTILSEILQSTVLLSIKKAAGLFSTPHNLAELLVRLSLWEKDSNAIDPFCGTGTIVKQILEIKSDYNIDGKNAVKQTWACDKFAFPVQVANLSVAIPEVISEPMQIFTHDAFDLYYGKDIEFINPKNGKIETKKLPIFSSIISNLPFVSFEDIEILNPAVFNKIKKYYEQYNIDKKYQLDGRSDLYCYIPFILLPLLKEEGLLGVIISNSWLSTKSGEKYRKLLFNSYNIEFVITSAKGRWFHNTDIVANILVLRKNKSDENKTAFISIKVDLNEEKAIEEIASDIFSKNMKSKYVNINIKNKKQIEDIEKYKLGFNSCFANNDWLLRNIEKYENISNIMEVNRGERRGWDPLFYPKNENLKNIESLYLKPVYKTAKGSIYYDVKADSKAFCCNKKIEELEILGHVGAKNWIKKFENEKNKKGEPLKSVLDRKNLYWYEMPVSTMALYALSINPDKNIIIYKFEEPTFVNQRLISISPKNTIDEELMHAILNSIFISSQIEALGFGRGLGVLDINSTKIKEGLYIPRIELISKKKRESILKIFNRIKQNKVINTIDIIKNHDYVEYNMAILESLEIEKEVFYESFENFKSLYQIRKAVTKI